MALSTEMLKKIHQEELLLLSDFKKICLDNDIRFSVYGGSMIGAVREKGFIQWDDDIDVILTRGDYNKLLSLGKSQLPSGCQINSIFTVKRFIFFFAQFRRKGDSEVSRIDIFPLDFEDDQKTINRKSQLFEYWHGAYCRHYIKYGEEIDSSRKNTGIKTIISKTIPRWLIIKRCLSVASNKTNGHFLVDYNDPYGIDKGTIKGDALNNLIDLPFEDTTVPCCSSYDEMLRKSFGDYMTPPPESNRFNTHTPKAQF
jgi:lipopolysaccharide cholinephosphotransferase